MTVLITLYFYLMWCFHFGESKVLAIEIVRHQTIAILERSCNNRTMHFVNNRIPLPVDMSKTNTITLA